MRVIDNKAIDLTDDEWQMYKSICESYTFGNNKGEDLFIDLFETDEFGIIKFIKPPSKRQTSFEVFLFIMTIFQHQHIRKMYAQFDDLRDQIKSKLESFDKEIERLREIK